MESAGRQSRYEDTQKLDDVREVLRKGDLKTASQHARVYFITPIAL